MHVGEAEVAAVITVGKFFVIEAQLMENGGMEVMHVHSTLHGVVTVFVGIAVGETGLEAAAGEAHGKTIGVMVSPRALILRVRRAAEFTAPPYDGIIK